MDDAFWIYCNLKFNVLLRQEMKRSLNVWSVITRLSARQIWKPTFVWRVVLWLGGGWPVSCRATYFFGKVYYGQVVVQHVFQCEASKHTAKAPCCGWLTGSRERCGAWWGVEGPDSGHKMLHIGPRLNRNSYLRTPPLYPHHAEYHHQGDQQQ